MTDTNENRRKVADSWDQTHDTAASPLYGKRRLADAVRELIRLTIESHGSTEELAGITTALETEIEKLRAIPHERTLAAYKSGTYGQNIATFIDRIALVGLSNPLSPPLRMSMEGDEAVGNVIFGAAMEGAPGFAHGGFLAAAFDQIFGFLQVRTGVSSLTGSLTIKYQRPTPVNVDLVFRARVARVEGKKYFIEGEVMHEGVVTATGEALFVQLDQSKMHGLFEKQANREPKP